ncbi:hypothetical protein MOMA_01865 [Moraxella macacae 0408225]|uniref:(Na+)-NQR maturation NqrM n=1 Tax=Moraxella macacae 0408225 TaxID=1230338 RepID=L2F7T8_9GAMM|nr:(Na+)-NQR maturation NqrM [Moraxella macacae]ELA09114.1 hypothetical protein MOMA_01865 [Moraxella macacae 0408225]
MLNQFLPMFFITFSVFALFFLCLGVGYLVKKQPLKGSCGGVANLMGDEFCQFCGNDPNKCDQMSNEKDAIGEKAKTLAKAV